MSPKLLFVTDSDVSEFHRSTTPFLTQIMDDLCWFPVGLLYWLQCRIVSEMIHRIWRWCVHWKYFGTARDLMGTMWLPIENRFLTSQSINGSQTGSGTARLSTTLKCTRPCSSPSLTNIIIFPMTWTRMSDASLRDVLCMGQLCLRYLNGRNDVKIWTLHVSKKMSDDGKMAEVIPTHMRTL